MPELRGAASQGQLYMCRLLMLWVHNDQCRWLRVGRKELWPDGCLLSTSCYDPVGISLYVASYNKIAHKLWAAKCLEVNSYSIVKTIVQRVLGEAEEKLRKFSVIEADITTEVRTRYLSNTSLDLSTSSCTGICIKSTEKSQGQEKIESAKSWLHLNILAYLNIVFSDSIRIYFSV
jgi:hypothetical protein